jgi:hypothetical protein
MCHALHTVLRHNPKIHSSQQGFYITNRKDVDITENFQKDKKGYVMSKNRFMICTLRGKGEEEK